MNFVRMNTMHLSIVRTNSTGKTPPERLKQCLVRWEHKNTPIPPKQQQKNELNSWFWNIHKDNEELFRLNWLRSKLCCVNKSCGQKAAANSTKAIDMDERVSVYSRIMYINSSSTCESKHVLHIYVVVVVVVLADFDNGQTMLHWDFFQTAVENIWFFPSIHTMCSPIICECVGELFNMVAWHTVICKNQLAFNSALSVSSVALFSLSWVVSGFILLFSQKP